MNYSDSELRHFLDLLDASDAIEVTDFEADFIDNNTMRCEFTEPQRQVILSMIKSYGEILGWN